jgi:hypothetical protein
VTAYCNLQPYNTTQGSEYMQCQWAFTYLRNVSALYNITYNRRRLLSLEEGFSMRELGDSLRFAHARRLLDTGTTAPPAELQTPPLPRRLKMLPGAAADFIYGELCALNCRTGVHGEVSQLNFAVLYSQRNISPSSRRLRRLSRLELHTTIWNAATRSTADR